jgi:hypothetical protein
MRSSHWPLWLLFIDLMSWCVIPPKVSASGPAEKLQITTGDIQEINLPEAIDVSLSRKGVIHAIHLGDGKWQLLALKQGTVLLETSSRSVLIEVTSRRKQLKGPPILQSPVCAIPEILCHEWPLVRGEMSDHHRWKAVFATCRDHEPCIFAVQLNDLAKIQREAWIKESLGDRWTLEMRSDGRGFITGPCHAEAKSRLQKVFQEDMSLGLIQHVCSSPESGPNWQLKAWLIMKFNSRAQQHGLHTTSIARGNVNSNLQAVISPELFQMQLHALNEKREGQTLAAPTIAISNGQESMIQNGGEFRTEGRGSNGEIESSWHQHGLKLIVKAEALGEEDVLLNFHASIKSRSDLAHELSLAEFKNALVTKSGQVMFAGSVNLHTEQSLVHDLFNRVPIMGPLFRRSGKTGNNQDVELWLELHRHGSDFKTKAPPELPP